MTAIIHPEQYRNFGHSRAKAIRAQCLECSGDSFAEVRRCQAKGCALWAFRMGYEVDEDGNRYRKLEKAGLSGENESENDSNEFDEELYPFDSTDENEDENNGLSWEVRY